MIKQYLKESMIAFFTRVLDQDAIKRRLVSSLRTPFCNRIESLHGPVALEKSPPYSDLGTVTSGSSSSERNDIIFITGRFRSGSTFFWNIFRSIPGMTAYYEPFNENQWFNSQVPDKGVDKTHQKVENYDKEYQGLNRLTEFYHEDWIREHLYMDEGFYEPDMLHFITTLIEHAPGRPVLQFNRLDFRLPWIRRNFPNAKIVHIYRHPRDQWCSSLLGHISSFPSDGGMEQFREYDGFYLRMWAEDLKYHFPFLDERSVGHPYALFYYLWKLSFLFGKTYADFSVCFENLIETPVATLSSVFEMLTIDVAHVSTVEKLIVKPQIGKWKSYADNHWFSTIESRCETVLHEFWGPK